MSTILYCPKGIAGKFNPLDVDKLIKSGYSTSPEQAAKKKKIDTNGSGKLSDAEIKEAAKAAGIKIGRKSIKRLKEELNL